MFPTPFDEDERGLTRRRFLEGSALVPIVLVVGGCGADDESRRGTAASTGAAASAPATTQAGSEAAAEAGILQATPPCDDGDDHPTEAQTEGPYYTPDTPRRSNLVTAGVRGVPAGPRRAARLLAGRRRRALRQRGLPPPRPPVRRRPRALRAADDRPRPVPRAHPAHPRQGPASTRQDPHDAALLPGRAAQPHRRHLRQLAAHGRPLRGLRPPGALPVRPELRGVSSRA